MKRTAVKITILVIISMLWGQLAFAEEKISAFVSIVPQKFFVEKIGKDFVDVKVMVKPGASPGTYEPKPLQMVALSNAQVYFAIGVSFEKVWLKKFRNTHPKLRVVKTEEGIQKFAMASEQTCNHDHHHGKLDPHIWTAPSLVMIQARSILNTLREIDPARGSYYANNYRIFINELVEIDLEFMDTFSGKKDFRFMVFHPSWGYLAKSYGLEQIPIEIEGKDPKPAQLQMLISFARKENIRAIFVQPQFSSKSAKQIAKEVGAEVIYADPLAEDWVNNLKSVAEKFKLALQ